MSETTQINSEVRRAYLEGQLKKLNAQLRAKATRESDLPEIQENIQKVMDELSSLPKSGTTSEESYEQALEKVKEFLEQDINQHLYYIAEDAKFAQYLPESLQWKFIGKEGLKNSSSLIRTEQRCSILLEVLENLGRIFVTKVYDDPMKGSIPKEALNMMLMDHWLKPKQGRTENTKWFDYLLFSIGNYKEENIQHILQVIGWKYLHPGEWQNPALCLYGRGGSGKNLLASTIMSVIFGSHQSITLNYRKLERFDGVLAGKMAVLFDEHPNKTDQNLIKAYVDNPTLEVELKNINTFKIANLALYFLATNDVNGPIRIENNGSERRWSMIHSTQDLVSVVAKEEGVSRDKAHELIKWADKNVFRNPAEVAYFLGMCIEEAEKLGAVPRALHGEDFHALKEVQKDATDEILEELFVDYKNFKFITLQTLYDLYKVRNKELNPSAAPMSVQKFNGRVLEFLSNRAETKHIQKTDKRYVVKCNGKPIKANVFYNSSIFEEFDNKQTEDTSLFMSMAYLLDSSKEVTLAKLRHHIVEGKSESEKERRYHERLHAEAEKQRELMQF